MARRMAANMTGMGGKKLWEGHAAMVSSWWEADTDQAQDRDPGGGGGAMVSSLMLLLNGP
jgi:hypothetical protein